VSGPRWPTPAELDRDPELALLAALDDTLELALRALLAVHPQLGDPDAPPWAREPDATRAAADHILAAARRASTGPSTPIAAPSPCAATPRPIPSGPSDPPARGPDFSGFS